MTIQAKFLFDQQSEGNRPRTKEEMKKKWAKAAVRTASRDYFCHICEHDIIKGSRYVDSNGRKRAHEDCAKEVINERG